MQLSLDSGPQDQSAAMAGAIASVVRAGGEGPGGGEGSGRLRRALPVEAVEVGFGAAGPGGGHGGCHRERGQGEGGGEGSWQAHWRSPGSIGAMLVMQLYTLKPGGAGRKRCRAAFVLLLPPPRAGEGWGGGRDVASARPRAASRLAPPSPPSPRSGGAGFSAARRARRAAARAPARRAPPVAR